MTDLTVCITSFKREKYLLRAIRSCIAAGVRKVVVFSMEPDEELSALLNTYKDDDIVKCFSLPHDLGCNELWLQAVYRAGTERVIVLHDDDMLLPEFGGVYDAIIAPALDDGVGFASWRGHVRTDDGKVRATEYFHGATRELDSKELREVVAKKGRLSLSPVVSVFNRSVLIHALKEAGEQLDSYLHPGMLLGTEIVAYLRHCDAYDRWLYVDRVLSYYGAHEGSGTVQAEKSNTTRLLADGYDKARDLCSRQPIESHHSRLLLGIHMPSSSEEIPADTMRRWAEAGRTVYTHVHMGTVLMFHCASQKQSALLINPTLEMLSHFAMPEDVIAYANNDLAFTLTLPKWAVKRVVKCGVCVAWRRTMKFHPDQNFITVRNGVKDGGVDFVAMSPEWWRQHRDKIPDMYVGRNFWDFVFRTYAERATKGECYIDDGTYHYPHSSYLERHGLKDAAQQHNFVKAKEYFASIGDTRTLGLLEDQARAAFNINNTRS